MNKRSGILLLLCLAAAGSQAADRFANVTIKTQKLTERIYMLQGSGGNIGVSRGSDGLLMIDDQFAPLARKIKAALAELGDSSPTYLLNTHYHGDHTGSNLAFGKDSIIVAHNNVRIRLVAEAPDASVSLPAITYEKLTRIYFNDEEIQLIHMPHGHTDGDTVVYFTKSNVVHMGDDFFRDSFPYVDLDAGGSVAGLIANIEKSLAFIEDDAKIIPGHGALATRNDLSRYLDMLKQTNSVVQTAIENGESLDAIISTGLDDKWESWAQGYINEERWITTIVNSIKKH